MKSIFFASLAGVLLMSLNMAHGPFGKTKAAEPVKIGITEIVDFINEVEQDSGSFILSSGGDPNWLRGDLHDIIKSSFLKGVGSLYFLNQLDKYKSFQWKEGMGIKFAKIISHKEINACFKNRHHDGWERFYSMYSEHGYRSYIVPLFSKDGKFAIYYSASYCGGLCGSGSIRLYQKKSGKWVFVESFMNWIS